MPKRIAVYGGSFNPPGKHHRTVVERVMLQTCRPRIDELVVVPCGPRPDKATTNDIEPVHRATMCDLTFRGMPNVRMDLFDLENSTFTRQQQLQERYAADGAEVWHVVGADLIKGGAKGQSLIQKKWADGAELWQSCNFIVIRREGFPIDDADLPPRCESVAVLDGEGVDRVSGSSSDVRLMIFDRKPYDGLVMPAVQAYVERYNLYRGSSVSKTSTISLADPRPYFDIDTNNPKAVATGEKYGSSMIGIDASRANCIIPVGGDGHMLSSIRRHWRKRLPFVGINAGHLGHLLNEPQLFSTIPQLLANLTVHLLTQLSVEIEDLDGNITHHYGVNDAWVSSTWRCAWVDMTVNGKTSRITGDGALISTPVGSTGYAWSMGAHPIPVDANGIILVGNNVCRPQGWKHMLLAKYAVVELVAAGGVDRRIAGFVDGVPLGNVHRMRCTSSRVASVELAFSPKRDLATKLIAQTYPK